MIAVGAAITTIRFDNTTAAAQTNLTVTFGQAFKKGDLPSTGAAVQLKAPDNSLVACQLDVKATNDDGSVRHAILSAILPALAASASVTYSIVRAASGPAGAAAVPSNFAGLNATVLLSETGTDVAGPQAGINYTADAAAKLAAGQYETWLSGPIASEWVVRVPLLSELGDEHPDLHARFRIRAYAGQARAKIDYTIENSWAKPKAVKPTSGSPWETVSITDRIYRLTLKAGSTTVHTRADKGYVITRLPFASNGVYDGNSTGLPNDSTVYTATITVDGVAKPISITGSAAQNFGQLIALFNTQLGGAATCKGDETMLGLIFKSATAGVNSSVTINYGTLFPALSHSTPYRPIQGGELIHRARTDWKLTFWWGAEPAVHIAHDKAYLVGSLALPNVDTTLAGSTSAIATIKAQMLANSDIGQNGVTKAYMGDVGYAPGIGIMPEWAALWLVNQGADAKYVMLKQADLGGSWPFHIRDYATDKPISFADWPYATFSPNAGDSTNPATNLQEKLPSLVATSSLPSNRNIADTAHHPDLFYVPYLVTGDHYYFEGLVTYQRFLGLTLNAHAAFRDGRKCLWWKDQVRGQAWTLRTTAHCLYIMPDSYPLRADVAYSMEQNRLWYQTNYIDPAGQYHNPFGALIHADAMVYWGNTGIGIFQDDFATAAAGRAVELGFTEWLPWLKFKAKFLVGRLTSGADYCWQLAASTLSIKMKSTTASPLYATFAELYRGGSFSAEIVAAQCGSAAMRDALLPLEGSRNALNAMAGYPDLIGGYAANLQPAVAYAATYDVPGGDDAWTVFDARALKPDYNPGPHFDVLPRSLAPIAPPDSYSVGSGQTMYFGKFAP